MSGKEWNLVDDATSTTLCRMGEQEYRDDHNRRFAVDAASGLDDHLPAPGAKRPREILHLETERVPGNDWVVRQENRLYPVEAPSRHRMKAWSAPAAQLMGPPPAVGNKGTLLLNGTWAHSY